MLAAPIKKPIKNQLCFEFAKDDNDGRQVKKKSVRQALKAKSVAADGVNDLRDLCVLLHGIAKKHVSPSNFHDFQPLRMHESPQIDVVLVKSSEKPGGIGEPATAVVVPAIANAVAALTGKRVRRLPITADALRQA